MVPDVLPPLKERSKGQNVSCRRIDGQDQANKRTDDRCWALLRGVSDDGKGHMAFRIKGKRVHEWVKEENHLEVP